MCPRGGSKGGKHFADTPQNFAECDRHKCREQREGDGMSNIKRMIRRSDLMEVLDAVLRVSKDESEKECIARLWEQIKGIPVEDIAPVVHGKWIRLANGRHECSICHINAPSFMDGKENKSYYCPLCGAKMDEVTE